MTEIRVVTTRRGVTLTLATQVEHCTLQKRTLNQFSAPRIHVWIVTGILVVTLGATAARCIALPVICRIQTLLTDIAPTCDV